MRKKFLSLALALAVCLGLAIPALAAPEIPSDVPVIRSHTKDPIEPAPGTYQIRSAQAGALTDKNTNTTITNFVIRDSNAKDFPNKTYILPLGSTVTVSNLRSDWANESGEVHIVGIQAYSDPDGDGVYDQWIYDFTKDPPLVPLAEEGVTYSSEENGRYSPQAYMTKDNKLSFDMKTLPGSVSFTSDHLYETFGPNTLVVLQVQVWTVLDPVSVTAFPTRVASTVAYLLPGEDAADKAGTPDKTDTPDKTPDKTDTPSAAPAFTDVDAGAYYAAPVAWAVEKSITGGVTPTTFGPDQNCTNAQILTFIWRAYGRPEPTIANPFTNSIPADYEKAAVWAYEKGLVSGDTFDADKPCTRAMAVTYQWQAAGSPEAAQAAGFTDVPADAAYAPAVAWAKEKKITGGVDEAQTRFDPDKVCSRGEIVTFLHRDLA